MTDKNPFVMLINEQTTTLHCQCNFHARKLANELSHTKFMTKSQVKPLPSGLLLIKCKKSSDNNNHRVAFPANYKKVN